MCFTEEVAGVTEVEVSGKVVVTVAMTTILAMVTVNDTGEEIVSKRGEVVIDIMMDRDITLTDKYFVWMLSALLTGPILKRNLLTPP